MSAAGPMSSALVVEDSVVQRQHLAELLREQGFAPVLEAADGHAALEQLMSHRVTLVVTDLEMPGMDGLDLLRRLARDGHRQDVIVISARDPRLLETIEQLGAKSSSLRLLGTLPKPVTAAMLTALLGRSAPGAARAPAPIIEPPDREQLPRALAAGEFVPYFQPKVTLAGGQLKGVEALARWQHPTHGLLGPQHFLPHFQGTPLLPAFTLAIVRQALQQLRDWQRVLPGLGLSLNLGAEDLAREPFVDRLIALVHELHVPAPTVIWEVTETSLIDERALLSLARLSLKGFGLSMDDYGVGYSTMQSLSRSPFTELKIDRGFVHEAALRSNRRAVLLNALDLGRRLGIATVAEGVETEADWRLLQALGCDIAQGFLVARPMPASALLGWVRSERARLRQLAEPDVKERATLCDPGPSPALPEVAR